MALKQSSRLLAIKTALGADALAVRSMAVQEQISRLSTMEVELSSEDGAIKFDDVIGHEVTLQLEVDGGKSTRFFHGFVSRFVQMANEGRLAHYHATVVPWLWFLTRTSDCRIFQEKSVPDIIEEVFQGHGFSDYKLSLSESYKPWEYCVQYRETDFNFVSRLMEQEGIYYFFEHEDGKHTLVLADAVSAHKPFEGYSEVTFQVLEQGGSREVIFDWVVEKEVQPVAFAQTDFDFTKPKASLLSQTNVSRNHGKAEFEIFDYPGEYEESDDGDHLSSVRLEEIQTGHEVLRGKASARGLAAGYTFTLKDHPRDDQNREYLITSVSLQADAGEYGSGDDTSGSFFSCSIGAIPAEQQFRPVRVTPKPVVQGLQTAIVSGPSGEEIHTDEYGRVKVQFHWDRHGKADENSSCWIRVSQGWAGKTWGSIHIPRIGQEVIVECLEGDPDRPIITGRVYNADQTVPYELPANKTQSGVKSRSSKDGTSENFNEIRFEDKKGSEELYIHAEKDKKVIVENDRNEEVGHDETIKIGNDRTETVENDESITIHGNRAETVDKDESITVSGARSTDISKNDDLSVGDNHTVSVGKDETVDVEGKRTQTVGKDETLSVGANLKQTIEKSHSINVGKSFVLEASDDITLKTGKASITLKKDGTVQIKGKDLNLEGSGKLNAKASGDMILKGSKIAAN